MTNMMKPLAMAAGLFLGGSVAVSAAVLDFTDDDVMLSGTFQGANYVVTGLPDAPNRRQRFDGDASLVSANLDLENDGIGITDDEVSYLDTFSESITVTFDRDVTLIGVHFLDLFEDPGDDSEEVAILTVDGVGVTLTFGALQPKTGNNPGYAFGSVDSITGREFIFTAGETNDQFAEPDYSLAALQIAPIPVPAAGLLLLGGLGALGVAKRRKR